MTENDDSRDEAQEHLDAIMEEDREGARANEEAAQKAKPRQSGTKLAVLAVLFVAVAAWDVYMFTRPPELPPVVEQEVDLAWLVVDAVDLIESYRSDNGSLPSTTDLFDLLDEEVSYTPRQGRYVVVAETEDARVEYDSNVAINDWMAARDLDSDGGGGS